VSKYVETGWFTVHLLNAIGFQIADAFFGLLLLLYSAFLKKQEDNQKKIKKTACCRIQKQRMMR